MFPYQNGYGYGPIGTSAGMGMGLLPFAFGGRDLPEEVRAALEEHRNEIHSEADMRRLVDELMLRR